MASKSYKEHIKLPAAFIGVLNNADLYDSCNNTTNNKSKNGSFAWCL